MPHKIYFFGTECAGNSSFSKYAVGNKDQTMLSYMFYIYVHVFMFLFLSKILKPKSTKMSKKMLT